MAKTSMLFLTWTVLFYLEGCTGLNRHGEQQEKTEEKMNRIEQEPFGKIGSQEVYLFTLRNDQGMVVRITNYGGIVTSIELPGIDKKPLDVVLGFDSLQNYLDGHPYFGSLVGRYANRIADGEFNLEGTTYHLAKNNGNNHLHGGLEGFDKKIWEATPFETSDESGLELHYISPDGEEGYPGSLDVKVIYSLTNDNELKINYHASSDAPTVLNLTHHSYFNLDGQGNGDILGHELFINADRFTPVNDQLIPTGELPAVEGGPMDFLTPKTIGKDIGQVPGGYDHNFVLNRTQGLELAARLKSPTSGLIMEVLTTQPGIQFYTGNFLDGTLTGKSGKTYEKHFGLCLETQHFPDTPNQPAFPSTILKPGEVFKSLTVYKFYHEKS